MFGQEERNVGDNWASTMKMRNVMDSQDQLQFNWLMKYHICRPPPVSRRAEALGNLYSGGVPRPTALMRRVAHIGPRFYGHRGAFVHDDGMLDLKIDEDGLRPMHPVSVDDRRPLYDGISADGQRGEGRARYLRERHWLPPEDRFHYSWTAANDVGWRLGDQITRDDYVAAMPKRPKGDLTTKVFSSNGLLFNVDRRVDGALPSVANVDGLHAARPHHRCCFNVARPHICC